MPSAIHQPPAWGKVLLLLHAGQRLLSVCAQPLERWEGPGKGGRYDGACRLGSAHGDFREAWEDTEVECQTKCKKDAQCVAYEFVHLSGYTKCELHYETPTHILPTAPGVVCKLKPHSEASKGSFVPDAANLAKCLKSSTREVHLPGDREFEDAKMCRNTRWDIVPPGEGWPNPVAVVRAKSKQDVQNAVKCVAAARIDTCARAGAHGFENDACCPGGVIIDVQDLLWFSLDQRTKIISFGSGHTNGQLYYKLTKHGLVVPGGTEGHVGISGLTLGCGRGMLTQLYGLICDSVVGVEYVDAHGEIQTANKHKNSDVLWIAKGGGGNFPGIVTTFIMQAHPEPTGVFGKYCHVPSNKGAKLLQEWSNKLDVISDSSSKIFSHITIFSKVDGWKFDNLCFGCQQHDLNRFHALVDEINHKAGGGACHTFTKSWVNKLLAEPGVNAEGNPEALLDNGRWPTNHAQSIMGSYLVPWSRHDVTEIGNTLNHFLKQNPPEGGPYTGQVYIYAMGGNKVNDIPAKSTAYGHRDAKFVTHWRFFNANSQHVRDHHKALGSAMSKIVGCNSFYNYLGEDMLCARDRDEWLGAFFSDVPKMKAIKRKEDPNGVFRSRLLPPPSMPRCGGVPSCTDQVLHANAEGHACLAHISWLRDGPDGRMPMSEIAACNSVASEYPHQCGGCKPPHLPSI